MTGIFKNIVFRDHPDSSEFKQILLDREPIVLHHDEHERLFDDEDIEIIKDLKEGEKFLVDRNIIFNYSDDVGQRSFSIALLLALENGRYVLKNDLIMSLKAHYNFDEDDDLIEYEEDEGWEDITISKKDGEEFDEDEIKEIILDHVTNSLEEYVDIHLIENKKAPTIQ